ncbi:MAG: hypothetical protein Q7S60_04950 [bacterium]|nr:hypothetical protein [bacterium]
MKKLIGILKIVGFVITVALLFFVIGGIATLRGTMEELKKAQANFESIVLAEKNQAISSAENTIQVKDRELKNYADRTARYEALIARMEDKDILWASTYRSRIRIIPVIFIPQDFFRKNIGADILAIERALGIYKAWLLKETDGATFEFATPVVVKGEKKSKEYEDYSIEEQAKILLSEIEIKIPRKPFNYFLVFMAGKKSRSWGEARRIAVIDEKNFDSLRRDLGWSALNIAISTGLAGHEIGHLFSLGHNEDWQSIMGVNEKNEYASDLFPGIGLTPREKDIVEKLIYGQ